MKANDFPRWVEMARERGATMLEVHRARKNGSTSGIFDALSTKDLDVTSLYTRMREDVTETKRLQSGVFELRALNKEGDTVAVERITITRDDEEDFSKQEPGVALAQMALAHAAQCQRALVDAVKGTNDDLRQIATSLSAQLVEHQSKVGETMALMFEVASLKKEREDAIQASADRRAMMAKGIEELGPILGSVLAKASKKTGPAFMGFFQSLKPEQLKVFTETLSGEQLATMNTLIELIQQEKAGQGT